MVNDVDYTNEAQRFHLGRTIAGRYRVERPLGEGALGVVVLARHVSLDEAVAIKFLRPELRRDPVAIGRLSREAKALARIQCERVARVLDVGATLSVGPYMVMEYLDGTDLGALLERDGPLPVARAVEHVLALCEALTVAHTAGIVHGDIKPENLFLARDGQSETLKVLDFGRNEPNADQRADIGSVGAVLHRLVTGRDVLDDAERADGSACVTPHAAPALESNVTPLPANLRAIITRCLERDPERRYQSVDELTLALAPLATLHERFRGRASGAFSRRVSEQAASTASDASLDASSDASLAPVAASGVATPAAGAGGVTSRALAWLVGSSRGSSLVLGAASLVAVAVLARGRAGPAPSAQALHVAAAATLSRPAAGALALEPTSGAALGPARLAPAIPAAAAASSARPAPRAADEPRVPGVVARGSARHAEARRAGRVRRAKTMKATPRAAVEATELGKRSVPKRALR